MKPYVGFQVVLLRSRLVLTALHKKQKGQITDAEFETIANQAVIEALRLQEEAGVDIVSDGEQRRDNFYSFIADRPINTKEMAAAKLRRITEAGEILRANLNLT